MQRRGVMNWGYFRFLIEPTSGILMRAIIKVHVLLENDFGISRSIESFFFLFVVGQLIVRELKTYRSLRKRVEINY